jgi:hypothetical protein
VTALSQPQLTHSPASVGAAQCIWHHLPVTRTYSVSPYSAVKRYSAKGDKTLHDAPPLRSAGRISSGAVRRYHLVAVTPLDLGAMLTADRP